MGDVELDWLCQVVARHCPAFFIHPSGRTAVLQCVAPRPACRL